MAVGVHIPKMAAPQVDCGNAVARDPNACEQGKFKFDQLIDKANSLKCIFVESSNTKTVFSSYQFIANLFAVSCDWSSIRSVVILQDHRQKEINENTTKT